MYSPAQASQLLGIPGSTIRRYCKLFGSFLSQDANKARRTFTDGDLVILSQVKELINQGVRVDQVASRLQPVNHDEPDSRLVLPGLYKAVEGVKLSQAEQQRQLDELRRRLDEHDRRERLPWYRRIFRK